MRQGFTLILMVVCGLFIMTSVCPAGDKWTKKADMPTARDGLSTSVVKGKIYAIGGYLPDDVPIKTVEEYDPVKNTWTKKADMPTARWWLSTSEVNGEIYAIGGKSAVALNWNCLLTVEVYNPATDKWTKGSDMPTARRLLSTSVVNGKIYAIGGSDAADVPLATVEEYTPEGWLFAVFPRGKLATMWGSVKHGR